jgi:hypothetical protein
MTHAPVASTNSRRALPMVCHSCYMTASSTLTALNCAEALRVGGDASRRAKMTYVRHRPCSAAAAKNVGCCGGEERSSIPQHTSVADRPIYDDVGLTHNANTCSMSALRCSHYNCAPLRCDRAWRQPTLSERRCPQGPNGVKRIILLSDGPRLRLWKRSNEERTRTEDHWSGAYDPEPPFAHETGLHASVTEHATPA